ncbi:recombinase family protein [Vibrio sp. S17_S38]|uniref:recombinase family protein n=1 Tax=Vibrio sp. S17_S38 TaxID=2720229 RepID=UPI001681481F|nr:recombinase family protein [Vibrio sp. S17_S38]MBD1572961.1 recombinase family protein [Vibrio sp. S17_S38]
MNNNTYGYIRISPKMKDVDSRIEQMQQYQSDLTLFKETGVRGNVVLLERPQYQLLAEKMIAGDTLVVWWLTEFSRQFDDCYKAIEGLLDKGIQIKTINQQLSLTPNSDSTQAVLQVLKGYADAETQHRLIAAEFGRRGLRIDKALWKEKFRGRRADKDQHQKIVTLLLEGKTLQAVADETGSSISTVKRVKAKYRDGDELGQMRGKECSHKDHHGRRHHRQHEGDNRELKGGKHRVRSQGNKNSPANQQDKESE